MEALVRGGSGGMQPGVLSGVQPGGLPGNGGGAWARVPSDPRDGNWSPPWIAKVMSSPSGSRAVSVIASGSDPLVTRSWGLALGDPLTKALLRENADRESTCTSRAMMAPDPATSVSRRAVPLGT